MEGFVLSLDWAYYPSNNYTTINPALWSACDIPTPGFCPSTLNSALRWDFPNITLMLVVLVVLNLQM